MKIQKRYILWGALGFIGITSIYLIVILGFWLIGKDKAYPRTFVSGISVSGKTESEIKELLDNRALDYKAEKLRIVSEKPAETLVGDLGVSFDTQKASHEAVARGSKNPFVLGHKEELSIPVSFEGAKAFEIINSQSNLLSTVAVGPKLKSSDGKIEIISGDPGKRVNFAASLHNLQKTLGNFGLEFPMSTFTIGMASNRLDEDLESEIISKTKSGIKLASPSKEYLVDQAGLLDWITLNSASESAAMIFGGDELLLPGLASSNSLFSEHKIALYLSAIATEINADPKNAKLGVSGGGVVVTEADKSGQKIDTSRGSRLVASALDGGDIKVELPVEVLKAEIRSDNLAELGLVGLLSTGYSNFAGSPVNRRHNIKVGASRFNGYLIRPDETFSFITVLGPVDASTGYLPELVIKDNKTIPEYGGGMCQVSSTTFRAALNAGLPIVERRAHSYPVSYYKPYGVDATVYIPKPDLVFKNDTGKYVLIQTRIEGNQLSFDFYGTKPQRSIAFSGNENAVGAVPIVEKVTPLLYDQVVRGNGSFTAVVWRHVYDAAGKLVTNTKFTSKYDSPDKYPH